MQSIDECCPCPVYLYSRERRFNSIIILHRGTSAAQLYVGLFLQAAADGNPG